MTNISLGVNVQNYFTRLSLEGSGQDYKSTGLVTSYLTKSRRESTGLTSSCLFVCVSGIPRRPGLIATTRIIPVHKIYKDNRFLK